MWEENFRARGPCRPKSLNHHYARSRRGMDDSELRTFQPNCIIGLNDHKLEPLDTTGLNLYHYFPICHCQKYFSLFFFDVDVSISFTSPTYVAVQTMFCIVPRFAFGIWNREFGICFLPTSPMPPSFSF